VSREAGAADPRDTAWGFYAFHIHYHEDLDRLLVELARPLLGELIAERRIDRFFFVRYALGGPHIRLRLRAHASQIDAVRARVTAAAADLFRRRPSAASMPADEIMRINESILRTDPSERDDSIYPDNIVRECVFHPELERYGGAALLPLALEYFALSSARALRFVLQSGDTPRARQLPLILRMLLEEAAGFAADGGELLALLASPFEGHGDAMKVFVERGDRLFAERKDLLYRIARGDIEALVAGSSPPPLGALSLADAARDLASALRPETRAVRLRASANQLHMSANRLGLRNPEEVYLGRALWRAAEELRVQDPSLWARLDRGTREPDDGAGERLRERAESAATDAGLYARPTTPGA
jgi:hypothetical protein